MSNFKKEYFVSFIFNILLKQSVHNNIYYLAYEVTYYKTYKLILKALLFHTFKNVCHDCTVPLKINK